MIDLVKPTPKEVRVWLDQSVGKYFRAYLRDELQQLQDDWSNGDFTREDPYSTIQLNSEALGKVQQIASIQLELEEWSRDDTDDQETEY